MGTRHEQDSTDADFTPMEPVLVVRQNPTTGQRESVAMQWGLVPSWADSPARRSRLIHARAETVAIIRCTKRLSTPTLIQIVGSRRVLP